MHLHDEEPEGSGWAAVPDVELCERVRAHLPRDRPALVLVDGRSGGGKTTFASRLAGVLDAPLVHTDDIAWHLDAVHWDDALREGVIEPWRRGEPVSYRPPGWVRKGRAGAVEVPASPVLVVEGVGAGRASLAGEADLVVWVQSDRTEARRRGIRRDIAFGRPAAAAEPFWDDWMRSEEPFLAAERAWERAELVVCGTPVSVLGPDAGRVTLLADGPLVGAAPA